MPPFQNFRIFLLLPLLPDISGSPLPLTNSLCIHLKSLTATGPVTFKNSSAGALFVQEISKLYAHGGGDCPELTMKGILNALNGQPDWGSPLYVFTDASAKDGSKENIEEVKKIADLQGNTINFFTTGEYKLKLQLTDLLIDHIID